MFDRRIREMCQILENTRRMVGILLVTSLEYHKNRVYFCDVIWYGDDKYNIKNNNPFYIWDIVKYFLSVGACTEFE